MKPLSAIAELSSLLESYAEPHVLFDPEYRIVFANSAYRECLGQSVSPVGRRCFEVSHRYEKPCDEAGESCPLARARQSGKRENDLHLHHTPQGAAYVAIELTPIRNAGGKVVYFVERMNVLPNASSPAERDGLVGRAPVFQRMLELVARVSPSEATVLLEGESGTGKELVANALHAGSHRAAGPFIAVDCSGIPETLFESELFGHERGAFTGATTRKLGLVEAAAGGTLFLDEVGDIPLSMQVKLLRLLETGTFRRVGSPELHQTDIRVISATHRNLRELVAANQFRADLYYRLNTFPIHVPALRERLEDIPLLVESLLARVSPGRRLAVSAEALAVLQRYHYCGNVRELRNLLERASLMCDHDEIAPVHLPPEVLDNSPGPCQLMRNEASTPFGEIDDREFAEILRSHRGSRRSLAEKLGTSERTLYRRIRSLGGR